MSEPHALPQGLVTFVFTDIEGSTKLFRDLGDTFPALLDEHNSMLREVWAEHHGAEVKTEGDAFFVAFADPADATRACVEAVGRLERHPWPDGGRIRIRAGVHSGLGYPRDGDYIAFPVNQAARIGAVGHGGQVVVSPATADLIGEIEGIHLHDLGSFRVRDFDTPIHLFQAERGATPTNHPPLRTSPDVNHNLGELPELIGRDLDLAGVRDQMTQSRLVSLLGPGGVGKTLLAKTVGRSEAERRGDGAWFVDLSQHRDMTTMRGALADALDIGTDEIDDHLRDRDLLIILDNCEQAPAAAADVVSRLMAACQNVSFLVTSREPLSIGSERLWRLEPLTSHGSAVDLFAERARTASPDFDVQHHRDSIVELCTRLDGLPLAIELAAARITAMSPTEILDSLTDVLRTLRSRRRDIDPRQQTASGLTDWSYQLLDANEQLVFRRIGVFSSEFTMETATVVAEDSGLDRIDVADIVWSLVEKSLVMPVTVTGSTRYRLLATTRAFAQRLLDELDEKRAAEIRLGHWYRSRFDPAAAHDAENSALLHDELDNIRSLAIELAAHDAGLGQWIAWILAVHWRRTEPARGLAELAALVDQLDMTGDAVVGMWAIYAQLHVDVGDNERAEAAIAKGRARMVTTAPIGAGWLANVEALLMVKRDDLRRAREIAEAAIEASTRLEQISLLNTTAIAASEEGDLDSAAAAFERVLSTALDMRHATVEATTLGNLAEIEHRRGNVAAAAEHTRNGLRLCIELGMTANVGFGLIGASRLIGQRGQWSQAMVLHRVGERLLDETGLTLFATDQDLFDRMLADALRELTPSEFDNASRAGASLTTGDATALAIDLLDSFVIQPSG